MDRNALIEDLAEILHDVMDNAADVDVTLSDHARYCAEALIEKGWRPRPAWSEWRPTPPGVGDQIVIVANDGCSSRLGFIIDQDGGGGIQALDGEDASPVSPAFLDGAIWAHLPDDYLLAAFDYDVL